MSFPTTADWEPIAHGGSNTFFSPAPGLMAYDYGTYDSPVQLYDYLLGGPPITQVGDWGILSPGGANWGQED